MRSDFKLSRRQFAALGASATAMFGAGRGMAFTADEASDLVGRVVAEINDIINSGRSESRMYSQFSNVLSRYADMPIMAQSVLGPEWRSASSAQRSAFTTAFQGYLARKYGSRFREFIGGRIEVQGTRAIRNFYEVRSTAILSGQSPFEVIFLVSDASGQNRFFNIVFQGVNLRSTESQEIGTMLDRRGGDIDALIAHLRTLA